MLHDMITNQWLWFSAAGIFAVFVGVFTAYSFYKLRPSRAIRNQQEKDGWSPTGRVDFIVDGSNNFILQAEDTRIVDSISGVEHRQIRWRKATLDEARAVVVAYHARLNLTMAGNFTGRSVKSYTANSDLEKKQQESVVGDDEAANGVPQG